MHIYMLVFLCWWSDDLLYAPSSKKSRVPCQDTGPCKMTPYSLQEQKSKEATQSKSNSYPIAIHPLAHHNSSSNSLKMEVLNQYGSRRAKT